jgi:hypothetical protein
MLRWLPAETGTEPAGFLVYQGLFGNPNPTTPISYSSFQGPTTPLMAWKASTDFGLASGTTLMYVDAVGQPFPPDPTHTVVFPSFPDTVYAGRGEWVCFKNQGSTTVDGKLNPLDSSPWECGNTDFYLPAGPPYLDICWKVDNNATPGSYRYGIYLNGVLISTLVVTVQ